MCKDHVVYQAEQDGGSESLAFKLYGDGIRELVLHEGLTQEELVALPRILMEQRRLE